MMPRLVGAAVCLQSFLFTSLLLGTPAVSSIGFILKEKRRLVLKLDDPTDWDLAMTHQSIYITTTSEWKALKAKVKLLTKKNRRAVVDVETDMGSLKVGDKLMIAADLEALEDRFDDFQSAAPSESMMEESQKEASRYHNTLGLRLGGLSGQVIGIGAEVLKGRYLIGATSIEPLAVFGWGLGSGQVQPSEEGGYSVRDSQLQFWQAGAGARFFLPSWTARLLYLSFLGSARSAALSYKMASDGGSLEVQSRAMAYGIWVMLGSELFRQQNFSLTVDWLMLMQPLAGGSSASILSVQGGAEQVITQLEERVRRDEAQLLNAPGVSFLSLGLSYSF